MSTTTPAISYSDFQKLPIKCEWCPHISTFTLIKCHMQSACPRRPELCTRVCQSTIPAEDLDEHERNCCVDKEVSIVRPSAKPEVTKSFFSRCTGTLLRHYVDEDKCAVEIIAADGSRELQILPIACISIDKKAAAVVVD